MIIDIKINVGDNYLECFGNTKAEQVAAIQAILQCNMADIQFFAAFMHKRPQAKETTVRAKGAAISDVPRDSQSQNQSNLFSN
jgi:hypothetical protein